MKVYYRKLHPDAQPPSKGTSASVGWDLHSVESTILEHRGVVRTGIAIACPPGVWLKLFDRSSLAAQGIQISAGVIDSDYRGEIGVVMSSGQVRKINAGDRIAQMVVMAHIDYEPADESEFNVGFEVNQAWEWVEATKEQWAVLAVTERGVGGFGSTGR